jgi:Zn-finger nucleic acid-binding protein
MGVLHCPKCGGTMRTYERNGVHVDQCQSCRGIFLDFGELEALTQLESQLVSPPPAAQGYPPQQPGYPQQQYPPQPGWGPTYGHGGYGHKRRRGFGGLFFSS